MLTVSNLSVQFGKRILFDEVNEIPIKMQMVCNERRLFDQRECSPKFPYIYTFKHFLASLFNPV